MVRLFGAVVCFVAPALLAAPASSADPTGSVRAQIASVRGEITASAGRIHQLTQAFDEANVSAVDVAQQLAADEVVLAATEARLTGSQRALRNSALQSYTGGSADPIESTPSTISDPALSSAYIAVAVGSLSESVDQYHLSQRQQEVAAAAVRVEQRAVRAAQNATATARDAAIATAESVQSRLSGLQSQLDQLQAASAAAGRAAAARAAAPASQGGPVGNSLAAAVSGVVQPSTSPASRASTPKAVAQPAVSPMPQAVAQPAVSPVPQAVAQPAVSPMPQAVAQPAVAPAPPAAPAPSTNPSAGGGGGGGPWQLLRQCESGGNYAENTGNGFYGAYQFSASTWSDLGYPGRPDQEPAAMQDAAAARLQAQGGWGEWPACAAALGL